MKLASKPTKWACYLCAETDPSSDVRPVSTDGLKLPSDRRLAGDTGVKLYVPKNGKIGLCRRHRAQQGVHPVEQRT
jgi:hypothetical protein